MQWFGSIHGLHCVNIADSVCVCQLAVQVLEWLIFSARS